MMPLGFRYLLFFIFSITTLSGSFGAIFCGLEGPLFKGVIIGCFWNAFELELTDALWAGAVALLGPLYMGVINFSFGLKTVFGVLMLPSSPNIDEDSGNFDAAPGAPNTRSFAEAAGLMAD